MANRAIVFLCSSINTDLITFAKTLVSINYDVFICSDRVHSEVDDLIHFIGNNPDDAELSQKANFYGCVSFIPNRACSRDKALWWFCTQCHNKYTFIWMIEDDVLIPHNKVLENIDNKYLDQDLLCTSYNINRNGSIRGWWHWKSAKDEKLPLPWVNSMICAIRVSQKLLNGIYYSTLKYSKLLMNELLFTTICEHNKLSYANPAELSTIFYRNKFQYREFRDKSNNLFHPVKDIEIHKSIHREFQNIFNAYAIRQEIQLKANKYRKIGLFRDKITTI